MAFDLSGLTAPITKLIEVVSQGIGRIGSLYITGAQARANVAALKDYKIGGLLPEKIEIGRDGQIEKLSLTQYGGATNTGVAGAIATITAISEEREVKRLKNVAAVVEVAQKELPAEVSPEKTDPDWVSRFFTYAPDVTSEEMQELWGKVLAGEVARSGTFSLRTLDVLRNMSRSLAELFTVAASVHFNGALLTGGTPPFTRAGDGDGVAPVFSPDATAWASRIAKAMEAKGLSYSALLRLAEAGLVFEPDAGRSLLVKSADQQRFLSSLPLGEAGWIRLEAADPKLILTLPATPMTTAGKELLRLAKVARHDDLDGHVLDMLACLGFTSLRLRRTSPTEGQADDQGVAGPPPAS